MGIQPANSLTTKIYAYQTTSKTTGVCVGFSQAHLARLCWAPGWNEAVSVVSKSRQPGACWVRSYWL